MYSNEIWNKKIIKYLAIYSSVHIDIGLFCVKKRYFDIFIDNIQNKSYITLLVSVIKTEFFDFHEKLIISITKKIVQISENTFFKHVYSFFILKSQFSLNSNLKLNCTAQILPSDRNLSIWYGIIFKSKWAPNRQSCNAKWSTRQRLFDHRTDIAIERRNCANVLDQVGENTQSKRSGARQKWDATRHPGW